MSGAGLSMVNDRWQTLCVLPLWGAGLSGQVIDSLWSTLWVVGLFVTGLLNFSVLWAPFHLRDFSHDPRYVGEYKYANPSGTENTAFKICLKTTIGYTLNFTTYQREKQICPLMIEMLVCISQYFKESLMRCILKNDHRKISPVFPSRQLSHCISVKAETIIMVGILWFINIDYLGSEMEIWAGGQSSLPVCGVITCTAHSGHGVCVEPGLHWSPEVWHAGTCWVNIAGNTQAHCRLDFWTKFWSCMFPKLWLWPDCSNPPCSGARTQIESLPTD